MASDYFDIAIALAGVCQAAKLVQQFAHSGEADLNALETSLYSLLQTEPDNITAVYRGSLANIKLGLETLIEQLNAMDNELARYWLSILALSGKLTKSPKAKNALADRIRYLPTQLEYYGLCSETMFEKMASIYTDIISPLGKKIHVVGSPLYLQQPAMHHRIRACLLAGIRSAVLWQQLGGTKWQILFSRRKILKAAKQIYQTI
ncbi:high frequency lysogenization protein HflD [Exercitatus varius]|uniref:high frequency lysogenization protein HflD n=1 Tax=Exercitatus varius TaxID=67857 RepID=UPI00294AF397|nr:high frequency lysogenization protein HflD [Exercitatus varius]MDG2940793.1 high frequency lysogenization protein HflD [Exercitatus varius]